MTNHFIDWTAPAWVQSTHTWIAEMVAQHNCTITGPITQPHVRAWSTVLRVPTDTGDCYFKAVAPVLIHEVPLTENLHRWLPDSTLPLLAVDESRGWMLLPDGGQRLREIIRSDRNRAHWERVLSRYAEAQIALIPHAEQMVTLGTPDRRLALLPRLYDDLLEAVGTLIVAPDARLSDTERAQLDNARPLVRDLCSRLAGYPIPESLHHGDLHDGNLFLQSTPHGEEPRFFDWGDASVTHPFVSLRTVFVSVEITFDLPDNEGADPALRGAYLEPWRRFAPQADLLAAFDLAQRIAPIVSALSWYRSVAPLPDPQRREDGAAVHHLLREFLQVTSDI